MQIHNNEDKAKVGSMTQGKRIRIFYANAHSRDVAVKRLTMMRDEMVTAAVEANRIMKLTEEQEMMILKSELIKSTRQIACPGGLAPMPDPRGTYSEVKTALAASRRRMSILDYDKFGRAVTESTRCFMKDPGKLVYIFSSVLRSFLVLSSNFYK